MKILLLGGYGSVGYETAKIVLNRTDAEIVIAGRSLEKAQSAAAILSKETNNPRVSGKSIDASNYDKVVSAFKMLTIRVIAIDFLELRPYVVV